MTDNAVYVSYALPIFDHWWASWPSRVTIRFFWSIARLVLGAESETDLFGNGPLRFVFVEADGSIEGLDVLRACRNGLAQTGLNVLTVAGGGTRRPTVPGVQIARWAGC